MSQFIETIKLIETEYQHIDLHMQRIQETCMKFYGQQKDLKDIRKRLKAVGNKPGIYKVSIQYDLDSSSIDAVTYFKRNIHQLVLIEDDEIQYEYKFANRTRLEQLQKLAGAENECIIIQNNRVTDASYANLVFWTGTEWHTPSRPLLAGTNRKFLLNSKQIIEKDILVSDLPKYQKVTLINAMLELGDIECGIDRIIHLSN
jgi:4-amino-4-deoxychorismate lyase